MRVKSASEVKLLGITTDDKLSFTTHIETCCIWNVATCCIWNGRCKFRRFINQGLLLDFSWKQYSQLADWDM